MRCITDCYWFFEIRWRLIEYHCIGTIAEQFTIDKNMSNWLEENCSKRYLREDLHVYSFESDDDATMFRLRFG